MKRKKRKGGAVKVNKGADNDRRKQDHVVDSDSNAQAEEKKRSPVDEMIVIGRNCLILAIVVSLPHVLMTSYYWVRLRSGIFRPVVKLNDTRPLLIVGSQSAGTTDMAKKLNALGAEIMHESSDAQDTFARDGTISWAHALQMFPHEPNIDLLCEQGRFQILHSTQFEEAPCSYRVKWNKCWQDECKRVFSSNYGCALRGDCVTNFKHRFLQVRHPLKTIASLVVKFCERKLEGYYPHPNMFAVMKALHPNLAWDTMSKGCIQIFAHYWYEYYSLLDPEKNKLVDLWYRVEDAEACEILNSAGFLDENSGVYMPTVKRVKQSCQDHILQQRDIISKLKSKQVKHQIQKHEPINTVNQGRLNVTSEDLKQIDMELFGKIKELARRYGYEDI